MLTLLVLLPLLLTAQPPVSAPPVTAAPPATGTVSAATPSTALVRGMEAYRKGDFPTAQTLLSDSLKTDDKNGEVQAIVGYLLVKAGKYDAAAPHLERAIALKPKMVDSYTNLGNALMMKDGRTQAETDRAIGLFQKAATLAPNAPEAHFSLGYGYARSGQFDKAAGEYRRTVALKPNDGRAWTNLGLSLRRLNQLDEAADALRKGAALTPQDADIWANLGEVETQRGDSAAAINALETARKLNSRSYPALIQLGTLYAQTSKFAESADAFGAAADISEAGPRPDPAPRYNQGVALAKLNRLDDAATAYDKVLTVDPQNFDAQINSGFILFRQNKLDAAAARFKAATVIQPNSLVAWKNLAAVSTRRKNNTEALVAWRKVAFFEPKNYQAREYLATAQLEAGHPDDAAKTYREMISLRKGAVEPLMALGVIYQQQAETETLASRKQAKLLLALQTYQEATRRAPKLAAAWNNLGVVHERRGEIPEALAAYRKALALDPNLADARANIDRFKRGTAPAPAPKP